MRRGSVGKGAASVGVDLVLHIAEQVLNDGASVFAWGTVLWALNKKVQRHRGRTLAVQDPVTISALAAAACPQNELRLTGAYMSRSICLTGGGEGMGTDIRDVWASSFVLGNGDVLVLFNSPSGLVLGEVTVPPEWSNERGFLNAAGVIAVFKRLNASA